jgi:hypothetical protein
MAKSICGWMVTRYAWLPPLGAVLGAGAALGVFALVAAANPRYMASVPFQVLPPPQSISGEQPPPPPRLDQNDVAQIIHRQQFLWKQDKFLSDVLATVEFHPQDKPNHECAWLTANKRDPLRALKRDLTLVPDVKSASFEIRMTARDPAEAFILVQAAAKVFLVRLRSDSASRKNTFLTDMDIAVKEKQADFQLKSDAMVDYSRRHGIDVLQSRFEIEKNSLQDLNSKYTLADAAASSAEMRYETIHIMQRDGKEVPLSPDLLLSVENDVTLKALIAARLNWEQERVVALVPNANPQHLAEIEARLKKIDEQIAGTRKTLTDDARTRMVKMLDGEAVNRRFLASYMGDIRKKKEDIVTAIGQDLLVWQQRLDELKEAGDTLAKLRYQLSMAQAGRAVDDSGIAKLDDPLLPDKPVGLDWEAFWPWGIVWAAVGLFTGLLAAWRLAWRRACRNLATPASPPAVITSPPA